jgi:hypothetical protein
MKITTHKIIVGVILLLVMASADVWFATNILPKIRVANIDSGEYWSIPLFFSRWDQINAL